MSKYHILFYGYLLVSLFQIVDFAYFDNDFSIVFGYIYAIFLPFWSRLISAYSFLFFHKVGKRVEPVIIIGAYFRNPLNIGLHIEFTFKSGFVHIADAAEYRPARPGPVVFSETPRYAGKTVRIAPVEAVFII